METIMKKLVQLRKEAGLTQKELGNRIGHSDSYVRQHELGIKKPKFETLKKYAAALGCTLAIIDGEITVRKEPYTVIECQEARDFVYITSLVLRDGARPVHLRRESNDKIKKEFCTATCPNCKETIFMKDWAERENWDLPKFCGECGQRLNWETINSDNWMSG